MTASGTEQTVRLYRNHALKRDHVFSQDSGKVQGRVKAIHHGNSIYHLLSDAKRFVSYDSDRV